MMTFYLFSTPTSTSDRSGYVLFYVIGLMTLLGFFATTSLSSMSREARAARNYVSETQAVYHAESGARLVKAEAEMEVQYRVGDPLLESGMFGGLDLSSQPNVAVYGYDSRTVPNPVPGDSNGRATRAHPGIGEKGQRPGLTQPGPQGPGSGATPL